MEKLHEGTDYKAVGEAWKKIRKGIMAATAAALIAMPNASCSNAQKDYEEGETAEQIAKIKAEIESLKTSYAFYSDDIARRQTNLADCIAKWDTKWAKEERKRIKEVIETREKTAKKIDEAWDKLVELQNYYQEGKVASEKDAAGWTAWVVVPKERSFEETK